MKRKISVFFVVIMAVVAFMSVPVLAAEGDIIAEPEMEAVEEEVVVPNDSAISVSPAELEKVNRGEVIKKSSTVVDEVSGKQFELATEFGLAAKPTAVGATGTHSGKYFHKITLTYNGSNYAYHRIEFLLGSNNTLVPQAFVEDRYADYYEYGSKGNVQYILNSGHGNPAANGTILYHEATFNYLGTGNYSYSSTITNSGGSVSATQPS